jgi:hypothetical protein
MRIGAVILSVVFSTPFVISAQGCCGTHLVEGNRPPTVRIEAPAAGAKLYRGHGVTIRAAANDSDGFVRSVTFLVDGKLAGTVENPPYSLHIIPQSTSQSAVTAIATDDNGATAKTATTYEVTECREGQLCDEELTAEDAMCCVAMPIVHWVTPKPTDRHVAPADITLEVTARSADGIVARVEFLAGNQSIGVATTAPFRIVWRGVDAGTYGVRARVTTSLGGVRETPENRIEVQPR